MIDDIFLHLDLTQAGQLGDGSVSGNKEGDVGSHALGRGEHFEAVHLILVSHLVLQRTGIRYGELVTGDM